MGAETRRWAKLWRDRDDAGHRHQDAEWLRFYAAELLLYAPTPAGCAIELGCGRGDLYPFLHDAFATYVGLDFSAAMTSAFHRIAPAALVARADATNLPIRTNVADFVFCNQLVQYLDHAALTVNLREVWRVLHDGGRYLMANIPDSDLRWAYLGGGLRADRRFSASRFLKAVVSSGVLGSDDGIGLWHARYTIAALGREAGFRVDTFSSPSYEYRFHAPAL